MKRILKLGVIFGVAAWAYALIGCAKVKFSAVPVDQSTNVTCASLGTGCTTNGNTQSYDYTVTIAPASVDILFVVDNSASMSAIQHGISGRFATLFSSIQSLNYHIAITTTDISGSGNGARSINQNGALQDGKLIAFGDGSKVLTPSSNNVQGLFEAAIMRNETLTCENYLQNHNYCMSGTACSDYSTYCPSEDTRAIAAANLAVQRNESGFLRDGVNLSVVMISNADERAAGGRIANYLQLQSNDQPQSLVNTVSSSFSKKTLTVDSIIIQPGDASCMNAQHFNANLYGWEGDIYQQLTSLTGGVQGSVCASDYGAQMGQIASTITDQVSSVNLPCVPDNGSLSVDFIPASASVSYQLSTNQQQVQFAQSLPPNTKVEVKFTCTTN